MKRLTLNDCNIGQQILFPGSSINYIVNGFADFIAEGSKKVETYVEVVRIKNGNISYHSFDDNVSKIVKK